MIFVVPAFFERKKEPDFTVLSVALRDCWSTHVRPTVHRFTADEMVDTPIDGNKSLRVGLSWDLFDGCVKTDLDCAALAFDGIAQLARWPAVWKSGARAATINSCALVARFAAHVISVNF